MEELQNKSSSKSFYLYRSERNDGPIALPSRILEGKDRVCREILIHDDFLTLKFLVLKNNTAVRKTIYAAALHCVSAPPFYPFDVTLCTLSVRANTAEILAHVSRCFPGNYPPVHTQCPRSQKRNCIIMVSFPFKSQWVDYPSIIFEFSVLSQFTPWLWASSLTGKKFA